MFHWFRCKIIGGYSGKRESAWFIFHLWLMFSIWLGATEFQNVLQVRDLSFLHTMWNTLTPFVLGWLAAAHGLQWASTQTEMLKKGKPMEEKT